MKRRFTVFLIYWTAILLPLFSASLAFALPNLTPYQPSGWSDKIVVSTTTGTNTDSSPLTPTDTLYVDWAVVNNGSEATAARFYTELSVDGVVRQSWFTDPPMNATFYTFVQDYSIGTLSAGTHTIKIRTDSTGAIAESNEGDNEYTKTITVAGTPNPPPTISPTALVALNGAAFRTGQTITYQATLTPGSTPTQVDIYLGTLLPDGRTFLSLVSSHYGIIYTALGPAPTPFLANVPLTQTVVPFSYTFTGGEPVGTYLTHAIIATAGSDPLQPGNQLSRDVKTFQFAVGGALNITSLSTNSAVPAQLLTIVGSGFDPTGDLRARFSSSSSGLHMDALPTDVTPISITVSVPPLGGANGPVTDVSVSVVQETGTAELISNSIGGFRIASLPSLTVAPGTVTIRILEVFTFLLPELKTQLRGLKTASGGAIDTAELRSALDDLATDEGALLDVIVAAMHDPTRADNVGTFRGIPLTLDQSALRAMDQLLGAYFLALGPTLSPPLPGASHAALIMEEPLLPSQSQTNTCDDIPARAQQMISEDLGDPVFGQVTAASHFYQAVGSCKTSGPLLKVATVAGGAGAVVGLAAISGGVSLTPPVIAVLVYPQIVAYTFVMINTANAFSLGHGTRQDAENAAKALDSFLHKIFDTTLGGVIQFLSPQSGRLFSILSKLNSVRKATGVLLDQLEGSAPPPPPTPPVLSVTPPALDFGSVTIGSSADRTFTVQNTSSGTLSGTASTSGAPFSIVSGGTYNLTAGQTQTVTVRFSPTSVGTSVGNVTFTGGGGATRAVSGVGTAGLTLTCPASVRVGKTDTCTITTNLLQNITTVPLSSSDAGVLAIPSSVTLFLGNQNTSTFTITGVTKGTATITAGPVSGATVTATVSVTDADFTLACPGSLQVGQSGACTITLNSAQTTPTTVPLSSSVPGILGVPNSVSVPANQTSATFTVTGVAKGTATITAGPVNGITKVASITVVEGSAPPPPPPPSGSPTITITSATCTVFNPYLAQITVTGLVSGPVGTKLWDVNTNNSLVGLGSCSSWHVGSFCERENGDPATSTFSGSTYLLGFESRTSSFKLVASVDVNLVPVQTSAVGSVTCPPTF